MAELQKLTVYIEPEDIVNRVLDEEEYKGKTLREWADTLTNPRTKADRIRALSDNEIAVWMEDNLPCRHNCPARKPMCSDRCYNAWLDWLKSPVEVEDA